MARTNLKIFTDNIEEKELAQVHNLLAKEVVIGKEKPINCSKCEYLKESTSEEKSMWAECGITKEQLNPFELCYSTGIGKRCPYTKIIT
jgi:hypothetical protein